MYVCMYMQTVKGKNYKDYGDCRWLIAAGPGDRIGMLHKCARAHASTYMDASCLLAYINF